MYSYSLHGPIVKGVSCSLSAQLRYFKNRFGGLGSFYFRRKFVFGWWFWGGIWKRSPLYTEHKYTHHPCLWPFQSYFPGDFWVLSRINSRGHWSPRSGIGGILGLKYPNSLLWGCRGHIVMLSIHCLAWCLRWHLWRFPCISLPYLGLFFECRTFSFWLRSELFSALLAD